MFKWLIIENGLILAKVLKDTELLPEDYLGTYDTVVSDPSGLFNVGDTYTIAQWETYNLSIETKLANAKSEAKDRVKTGYTESFKALVGEVNFYELSSWTKQESQARAYIADNLSITPLLDGLLLSRNLGETKLELANKIIAAADAYEVAFSAILGQYQNRMNDISLATTESAVDVIIW